MQEVKNKAGEVLGSYELTVIEKPDTYTPTVVNKEGQEVAYTKEVNKAVILKLASQQFNTNVRNFVAGLARVKQDTKTAVMKDFIKSFGIDTTLPTDEIKAQLDKIRLAQS